ncbi:MAG: hypothetical protein AAGH71_03140 [Planctomycetota bacterium]
MCQITEGMSFRDLGAMTGISPESARRYGAGSQPPLHYVITVAQQTGTSLDWLLYGVGPQRMDQVPDWHVRYMSIADLCQVLGERIGKIQQQTEDIEKNLRRISRRSDGLKSDGVRADAGRPDVLRSDGSQGPLGD